MAYTLVEYFVRHYTLVIDNTESTYGSAVNAAKTVMLESAVTVSEYKAMSNTERAERFASEIGDRIISLIQGWCEEAISDRNHPGSLLMSEIMIFADSEIEWYLGKHYLPEESEFGDYLIADEDE